MPRSRSQSGSRDGFLSWRTPADVGAILFLAWFWMLLARPQLARRLQSILLDNPQLLQTLPYGVATPRVAVSALTWLGVPLATSALFVSLLFASRAAEREPEPPT